MLWHNALALPIPPRTLHQFEWLCCLQPSDYILGIKDLNSLDINMLLQKSIIKKGDNNEDVERQTKWNRRWKRWRRERNLKEFEHRWQSRFMKTWKVASVPDSMWFNKMERFLKETQLMLMRVIYFCVLCESESWVVKKRDLSIDSGLWNIFQLVCGAVSEYTCEIDLISKFGKSNVDIRKMYRIVGNKAVE